MKYQKIYSVIDKYPGVHMDDRSYWFTSRKDYVAIKHPLGLLLDVPEIGLRLWATHEYGRYSISTANMMLDRSSNEYSNSIRHYSCRNQTDMAEKLEQLLSEGYGENHAAT